MLTEMLFPGFAGVRIDMVSVETSTLHVTVSTTQPTSCCPMCHTPSPAIHSRYGRTLADLPLGDTTTSDALWAGVPILTCAGETFCSRVAGSLLHAIGLPELVTTSLDAYEAAALHLAQHPDELPGLRATLATNRDVAPLFDTPRYVRNLEAAYRALGANGQGPSAGARSGTGPVHRDISGTQATHEHATLR
jgi:hypothetical protein